MDAVCDMRVQKIVIMSAAQIGKTDALILNPIGYYMHYDPSPIMVMQPTIQMAETFSKDRLSPMSRWYGAFEVRQRPGSADDSEERRRYSSAHSEIVMSGGGARTEKMCVNTGAGKAEE